MRAPEFFNRADPSLAARLLAPLGALYGALTARRMARPGGGCGVPVICAGNFTAGGAGKTPLAIAIGRALIAEGETPFFLSRGYGGAQKAPRMVDLARDVARQTGDEALLLARVSRVVVARDRAAGARAAVAAGASVIVMDDGLQNPDPRKDLTFAAVDAGVGLGNGLCLPAGPLRAPLAAQLPFVGAIVLVGDGAAGEPLAAGADKPVLRARLVADGDAGRFQGRRVVAFAGIGRPEKFFETLRGLGAEIATARAFPDHHFFTSADREALARAAAAHGAILVTTEKDRVRLPADFKVETVPVRLEFNEPEAFETLLRDALRRARS